MKTYKIIYEYAIEANDEVEAIQEFAKIFTGHKEYNPLDTISIDVKEMEE